jgi:hypothetical protein
VGSVDTQLDFLLQELGTTERKAGDALRGTTTAEDAARVFSQQFLRPGIPHLDRRIASATRQRAAKTNGGPPVGLLGDNKQGGIGGFLGDPDKRARLAIGLEGLTLNPNKGNIAGLQAGIKGRATDARANKTAEWLRKQGRNDLADAVAGGFADPGAAVQMALQPAAARKTTTINGQLVDAVTGEVIADLRPQGGDVPAAIQALRLRAEAGGLVPGSDEYKKFMIAGGASGGMSLTVAADGTVSLATGAAAKGPKSLTETESKSAIFATRAEGALGILDKNDAVLTDRWARLAELDPTGFARTLQSDEFQSATQAADEFLQAILRKDSGAAITEEEQDSYGRTYIPQVGDGAALIAQKKQARARALAALEAGMPAAAILAKEAALASVPEIPPGTGGITTTVIQPQITNDELFKLYSGG